MSAGEEAPRARRRPRAVAALLVVAASAGLGLAAPGRARAHARSVSYSTWWVRPGGARVRLRMTLLDVDGLEAALGGARLEASLGARLHLRGAGGPCVPEPGSFEARPAAGARGRVVFEWRVACPSVEGLRLRADLDALLPGHLHFARAVRGGVPGPERALGGAAREAALGPGAGGAGPAEVARRHVSIGVEHILSGWDHVLFLLALLLVAPSLRGLLAVVTGFTVGHSLTLALAALGYASPEGASVEALIGLSIALVAVENVWLSEEGESLVIPVAAVAALLAAAAAASVAGAIGPVALLGLALFASCHFALLRRAARPERWRWAVASLFGLVHGFGFAGVLTEAGLGPAELPWALLGFNGGVELGQLALVLCAWPLLRWARRRRGLPEGALVRWGSAAAACAGVFAFVSRGF